MRTVSFAMNISIDGYCDHTLFRPDPMLHDYFTDMMRDVDLLFFGRVMYQLMFPFWADVAREQSGTPDENRFAVRLSAIDRVVVSRSLTHQDEQTQIVRDNPVEALRHLKQLPGKKISVDSVSLLPELVAAGLIDEFHLVIHPVFIGRGRRLFAEGSLPRNLDLKLVDIRTFSSGCVAHHYQKA